MTISDVVKIRNCEKLTSKFQIIWAAGEFVISSTLDVLFYAALAKRGPKIGLPMLPRSITTPLDSDREKNEVRQKSF